MVRWHLRGCEMRNLLFVWDSNLRELFCIISRTWMSFSMQWGAVEKMEKCKQNCSALWFLIKHQTSQDRQENNWIEFRNYSGKSSEKSFSPKKMKELCVYVLCVWVRELFNTTKKGKLADVPFEWRKWRFVFDLKMCHECSEKIRLDPFFT